MWHDILTKPHDDPLRYSINVAGEALLLALLREVFVMHAIEIAPHGMLYIYQVSRFVADFHARFTSEI
jgi:hypothetical protein